ncbi:response regulator [Paenibacillus thermoaerophilus]|uniref:Response regulator n=1 Tax=Paenibacillus thermoaerophilus TaxID=1215385 RepID=A0ABW2UZ29_9BACL|nr:response regulator transcription factor [Paenibacillus thermoaerophilus]TMV17393.1 response regulator transcription factor [Paenibacillus thermoaerophilus]
MISVLIVDDDPFIRESMRILLELDPELTVAGTCRDGREAYEFAGRTPVDVVLMDIRMPGTDGVEGTRLIRSLPNPPAVLILTTFDDDDYIAAAIRHGAGGYLLKNVPPARIAAGIKTVHDGSLLIHPDIARKLAGMLDGSGRSPANREERLARQGLTGVEREIVRLIADGLSNKEIAAALYLSEGTVKNYVTSVLGKLELRDRTQIAIYYLKMPG